MLSFLPQKIQSFLTNINLNDVYEIRLRKDQPLIINYQNQFFSVYNNQLTKDVQKGLIILKSDLDFVIKMVTEYSIYSYNEQLKNGYLTTKQGVRIGVAGTCVVENGKIITINNISSINIRVPHNVIDASKEVFFNLTNNGLKNGLIISPPGQGKTTILKDLIRKLKVLHVSVLVIDERGELFSKENCFVDYVRNSDKLFAFNYGIRSLSPKLVITDEIASKEDFLCVKRCIDSGIKIIATMHGNSIEKVKEKDYFIDGLFDKYILLKEFGPPGKIEQVL